MVPGGCCVGNCRLITCLPISTWVRPLGKGPITVASNRAPEDCAMARNIALACASGMGGNCGVMLICQTESGRTMR